MIIKISNNNLHITKMAIETDTDFIFIIYEKKNFLKILFWVFWINVKTKLQFNLFLSIIIYVKKYIFFLMFYFSVFFSVKYVNWNNYKKIFKIKLILIICCKIFYLNSNALKNTTLRKLTQISLFLFELGPQWLGLNKKWNK